jgi:translation initiation factor 2 beta subunit (eIF-2beta)/eIF-5
MEKMFKYKRVYNNKCKRCGDVETYKHLMWECKEARQIWIVFN